MEDHDPETDEIAYVSSNDPIEDYDIKNDTNVLSMLYSRAKELYDNLHTQNVLTGEITPIKAYGNILIPSEHIEYFDIEGDMSLMETGQYDAYRIFSYKTNVYYISVDDAFGIIDDNRYEDKQVIINEMVEQAEMSMDMSHIDDCMFMIESVIKSMFNYSTVNENCKIIKHTKIQTDNDVDKSMIAKEAKYGTKEENDFKQELEDKQKKDGTIGALDPQGQEESVEVKPKLPNVNLLTEKKIEVIYEVNDKVIYKDAYWDIYAIDEFDGDKQRLHITREGVTEEVLAKDVEPDPEALNNLEIDDMEFNNLETNDNITNLKDLNKKTVECNIVVDGYKLNVNPMKVKLSDIVESNLYLDVEGDDETTDKMHVNSLQFDMENWPYAVLANEDDEPLRKIKVNPTSYINAGEDDMVEVLVADKLSKLPKSSIRILS